MMTRKNQRSVAGGSEGRKIPTFNGVYDNVTKYGHGEFVFRTNRFTPYIRGLNRGILFAGRHDATDSQMLT